MNRIIEKVQIKRVGDNDKTSLGVIYLDGIAKCGSVEDREQKGAKIRGETRVPNGWYTVSLRNEGGKDRKYLAKYGAMHKGMLCIHNAPNWKLKANVKEFQYILIHTGNTDDHTEGCLLLNYAADGKDYRGSRSVEAYKAIYPEIAKAIEGGEEVMITYIDMEDGK